MHKFLIYFIANQIPTLITQKIGYTLFMLFFGIALGLCQSCTSTHLTSNHPSAFSTNWQKKQYLSSFEVRGKIGFKDGKTGNSANFIWVNKDKKFNIQLYGPFGAGAVRIQSKQDSSITLTDTHGQIFSGNTPERLLKQVTGLDIPISGLRYWLQGLPAPDSETKNLTYVSQHIQSFSQDGWTIRYQHYALVAHTWMPKSITLQRDKIQLKILLKHWE